MSLPIGKPKTPRDPDFRAFVTRIRCALCEPYHPDYLEVEEAPVSDPHHLDVGRGFGMRGSDYYCVPLCRKHHNDVQDGRANAATHNYLWRVAARLIAAFFTGWRGSEETEARRRIVA